MTIPYQFFVFLIICVSCTFSVRVNDITGKFNKFELKVSFLGLVTFGKKLQYQQWIQIKIADVPYVKNYKIVIIWKQMFL